MKRFLIILLFIPNIHYSQWIQQQSNTTDYFFACSFINANTGWVSGEGCRVYHTLNGGINWTKIFDPSSSDRFECMVFKNEFTGWAGSYQSKIYKTTNKGYNWTSMGLGYPRILDISFPDLMHGWAVGEQSFCAKTTNGGTNWSGVFAFSISIIYCVNFINNLTGFIGGIDKIVRTTNGGVTWDLITLQNYWFQSVQFINYSTGWALCRKMNLQNSSSGLAVLKTVNAGINWTEIYTESLPYGYHHVVLDAHFINENYGYSCGNFSFAPPPSYTDGTFSRTTNGGLNWQGISLPGYIYSLEDISFVDMQTGNLVGSNGKIFKTTNGGPVGLISDPFEIASDYSLSQNYPNPFNPSTKIKFAIPNFPLTKGDRGMSIRLTIYDLLGREVTTLVNEQLKPGTYEVEWDGTNYPSGVYFYKLTSDFFNETKRMVLIK